MKRLFILFGAVAFIACTNSNNQSDGEMLPLMAPCAKIEPFDDDSGVDRSACYFADGILLEEGFYVDGLREGIYTIFYANGYIKSTGGYVRGKREGQFIVLDDKGQIQERSTFHNDKLNGTYVKYNRSQLKETKEYVDGNLNGQVEKYYPNGKIMERSNYVDNALDGIARWYDQEGNVSIEYTYKMGELVQTPEEPSEEDQ